MISNIVYFQWYFIIIVCFSFVVDFTVQIIFKLTDEEMIHQKQGMFYIFS